MEINSLHYRGQVLATDGSKFTFYAVDFGFVEKVKNKRVREIPQSLESFQTTNYFGKILFFVFISRDLKNSAVKCCLSEWNSGGPPTSSEPEDIKKKLPVSGR